MKRWEHLHLAIYWNMAKTGTRAVYSNGQKMDSLCGAGLATVNSYLEELCVRGWDKFAQTRSYDGLLETYYFERAVEADEDLVLSAPQVTVSAHRGG